MSHTVIEIKQGKLKGTLGEDYYGSKFYKFLGIPYAKAPIGDLRFKAPQPPEPWSDIRDATKEGPECPSPDMYFTYFIGNEDNCLNLNVFTKELPKDNLLKKPVMVWIHGGGYIYGSNKQDLYGPEYLMTQDIVLVVINYRLGILGFASFKDQSLEVPGNAGLKDMRMALRWVQQNIEMFGGDKDNVTIFGESAGSASVHYLILSPTTKGLFHKAILQSGCALNNWSWGKLHNSLDIAKYLGYKDSDEKKIFEKLKRETARNIVSAQKKLKEKLEAGTVRPWGPVIEPPSDDAILIEDQTKIMEANGGQKIPMIIGYNSNEGMFFELVRKTVPGVALPLNFEDELPYELGLKKGSEESIKAAEKIKKAYFDDKKCNEENVQQVYTLKGDTNFMHKIQKTMELQAKYSDQPVYAYRMSIVSSLNYFHIFCSSKYFKTAILCSFLSKLSSYYLPSAKQSLISAISKLPKKTYKGVVHADDLLYLFPTFYSHEIKQGSPEDFYIQRFVKMWTNFAKYGDPTPDSSDKTLNSVKWKPITGDNLQFLDIGEELSMIENVDQARLEVWNELYKIHFKL